MSKTIALGLVLGTLVLGELVFRSLRSRGWRIYTSREGLAYNRVQAIATGPDGALWFGTPYGVSRLAGEAWTTWDSRNGLPEDEDVRAIAVAPDGVVWIRTPKGYLRFDGQAWAHYKRLDILIRNWTRYTQEEDTWPVAVAPDGSLWFGTGSGALHFSEHLGFGAGWPAWTVHGEDEGLPDGDVLAIAVGPGGDVWAGTRQGAARYDGQAWVTLTREDGLAHNQVLAIGVGLDGVAWFSTWRGLCRFDGRTWTTVPLGSLGLARPPVALAVDGQGHVWMATPEGVGRWVKDCAAPLWALSAWTWLRAALIGACFVLAAAVALASAWGKRSARRVTVGFSRGWSRLTEALAGTWSNLRDRLRSSRPRDRLRQFGSRHRTSLVALALVVMFGLILRLWRLDYDQMLPYVAHADEQTQYNPAIHSIKTGDLNPHFFNYPSLTIYIDAIVLSAGYHLGALFGQFESVADLQPIRHAGFARGIVETPGMLLLGRATTALFGALSVGLMFAWLRLLGTRRSGALVAALLLAVSMEHIRLSHYMTVDVIATFFTTASIACCTLSLVKQDRRFLWAAAICGGLATSSKYNYALLSIPVALSVALDPRLWINQKIKRIFACGVLFCLAFVLTSPYVLLDIKEASQDIRYEMRHYAQGHLGQTGNSFVWYVRYLWDDNPVTLLLGLPGMAIALWRKKPAAVPIVVFAAIYFGMIGMQTVHMDRNVLPVMVLLMATAGIAVGALLDRLPSRVSDWRLEVGGINLAPLAMVIVCVVLAPSLWQLPALLRPAQPSGQAQAQAWFNRAIEARVEASPLSLPNIAAEGYTIYLDPHEHRIKYVTTVSDIGRASDFVGQGYDIVLLGSGMYGRFYANPVAFADRIDAYDTFFKGSLDMMSFESRHDPLSFVGGGGRVYAFFLTDRGKAFKAEAESLKVAAAP